MRMQSDLWYLAMPGTTVTLGPVWAPAAGAVALPESAAADAAEPASAPATVGPAAVGPVPAGPVPAEPVPAAGPVPAEPVPAEPVPAADTGPAGLTDGFELAVAVGADGLAAVAGPVDAGGAGLVAGTGRTGLAAGAAVAAVAGPVDAGGPAAVAGLVAGTGRTGLPAGAAVAAVTGLVDPGGPAGGAGMVAAGVTGAAGGTEPLAAGVFGLADAGVFGLADAEALAAVTGSSGADDPFRERSGPAGWLGSAPAPALAESAGVPAPAGPAAFAAVSGVTRVFSRVEGPRPGAAAGGSPAAERTGAVGWPNGLVTSGRFESVPETTVSGLATDAAAARLRAAASSERAAAGSGSGRPAGACPVAGESVPAADAGRTAGSGRAGT
jgi:hypothetical protein